MVLKPRSACRASRSRIPRRKSGQRALLLFSGPASRKDRLANFLRRRGWVVDEVDVLNTDLNDQDLLDDTIWLRVRRNLERGVYSFVFSAPPCRTFSAVRRLPGGPPPVRDPANILGFPKSRGYELGISDQQFEQLRGDNLLAQRTAEASELAVSAGGGFGVEQPAEGSHELDVSMFDLPCFKALVENLGKRGIEVKRVEFDQCRFGGRTTKPTWVLYVGAAFDQLHRRCNHPRRWRRGVRGRWVRASHPIRVGKAADGGFATASLAAYPRGLNFQLARHIAETDP